MPQLALELWTKRRPGKDLLVRAMGKRAGVATVIDATAGLGRDASALAQAGFFVTACERAPALGALWKASSLVERLSFHEGDAIAWLTALVGTAHAPDAVYLDPMYEAPIGGGARKAMQKKNLRDVRAVVGGDADVADLFAVARRAARLRVVVKRPRRAPPLGDDVAHSFLGASTRFDLYLTPGAALAAAAATR